MKTLPAMLVSATQSSDAAQLSSRTRCRACLSSGEVAVLLTGCLCFFAVTVTRSVINYWCTFFFPRKIQKGPGILTGLLTAVLTWFVVTYKLAYGVVPHWHPSLTNL